MTRLLACLVGFICWTSAFAADSRPAPHVRVDLVAEVASVVPGSTISVLFRQDIDDDWHTYWVNPGDSGDPPTIDWTVPEGVSVGEFEWPYPERIAYGPLMNFGYHHAVLLPFSVSLPAGFSESVLQLEGQGRVLVCADICIPEKVSVSLTIPVGDGAKDESVAELFATARSLIPAAVNLPATLEVAGEALSLNIALPTMSGNRIEAVEYFPYERDLMDNPGEQTYTVTNSGLTIGLQKGFAFDDTPDPDFSGIIVVRETSGGEMVTSSFSIKMTATNETDLAADDVATEEEGMSFLVAAAFAFLGGLILNLMPCVFPVLSIKILSLMDSVQDKPESIRLHGWVYAAGVVASFVGIALILILLRLGGEAIGWGFQLQSPLVVGLLAYLFILIGLNLLGVFEVGTSVMSLGGGGSSSGYLASFSTGVLATIVAAPCTAPFMGAAVGYALTQSTLVSLMVFGALGAGMAVPYLLLCYSPGLLAKLPAPGRWMQVMKEVMAFPMFASAIWLVWVLGLQTSATGMMQVLAGALMLGLAVWLLSTIRNAMVGRLSAASLFVLAIYLVVQLEAPLAEAAARTSTDAKAVQTDFIVYEPEAVANAVEEGPVFVNFTAAWCITCKVNEANALNRAGVRTAMKEAGVTYFRADWTSEDPVITAALAEYGRSGVPLYLLYAKGATRADVLPQLLTEDIVIDALNRL